MYRGDNYDHGFSETDWDTLTRSTKDILIKVAQMGDTISYTDLVAKILSTTNIRIEKNEERFFHLLGLIGKEAFEKEGRILTAVVVRKNERRPGSGFSTLARSLGKDVTDDDEFCSAELKRVHAHHSRLSGTHT